MDIPQELIDRFIDELSESTQDLKSIALVGRPWLSRARYHLFRFITLAPLDPKEVNDYFAYLRRRASSSGGRHFYNPLSDEERRFLHSPPIQKPQQFVLQSISDTLTFVRGLKLESAVRIGGTRKIPAADYFGRWLGFGGDDVAEESIIMRDLGSNESFYEMQQQRWISIDLPWGWTGIHELPFRNLRYLHIQWSVFSWVTHPELSPISENQWPDYQFKRFIQANGGTLEHISVDEYPGFQMTQYEEDMSDSLLYLLTNNAPQLRTLFMGGILPRMNSNPARRANRTALRQPPIYSSGEAVPAVSSNAEDVSLSFNSLSLERFYLRGFESESMLFIEDSLLNGGALAAGKTKYLGLSTMPSDYNYKTLFSSLKRSITHLTLDLDKAVLRANIKFLTFPQLQCLQLIVNPLLGNAPREIINTLCRSSSGGSSQSSSSSPNKLQRLHFGFNSRFLSEEHPVIEVFRPYPFIDHQLHDLTVHQSKVALVTIALPEIDLERAFPYTIGAGSLKSQGTNEWWCRPNYL
ncbi:hypothetical protein GYMLUDRAFT_76827 [Collybiopsis luxurians FD-317 M1]|uniref:Uncharacterized protein n=1 Tax=Collybiopsis luxurians FD-317 M1 TaxID=944289 RepID=A0A0D0BYJ2_9AGAR|nr:hypothetical protein GYMLUDRAFT_76827 [Collybiopsis luxurians FD-317 M1]